MAQTVAIIGASSHREKFGNKAVRAFRDRGYTVWPVHPHESTIEGLPAYASIEDVPEAPDMVTVYVPPDVGVHLLEGIARRGAGEVWFNPGSESDELVARARALGLSPILACSIVGIGMSPGRY